MITASQFAAKFMVLDQNLVPLLDYPFMPMPGSLLFHVLSPFFSLLKVSAYWSTSFCVGTGIGLPYDNLSNNGGESIPVNNFFGHIFVVGFCDLFRILSIIGQYK